MGHDLTPTSDSPDAGAERAPGSAHCNPALRRLAAGFRRWSVAGLRRSTAAGFTRIEILVGALLLAILAAVAVPSLSTYRLRTHRAQARSALLDLAAIEERYFNANGTYTRKPADLGFGARAWPIEIGDGYYEISIVERASPTPVKVPTGAAPGYTITARALGEQQRDSACQTFSIDSSARQTASGDGASNGGCWRD